MGMRQPSTTGAFFAQASAGAAKQKEARDKLKKPQAIGGSAGVGTQMVAATTDVQQKAAQNVQATGQQAGKELVANEGALGSSTAQAISGTPTAAPATAPGPTVSGGAGKDTIAIGGTPAAMTPPTATAQSYKGISGPAMISPEIKTTQDTITKLTADLKAADVALRTMKNPAEYKKLVANKKQIESDLQANQTKLAGLNAQSALPSIEGVGAGGDVTAVENVATQIRTNIDSVNAQIEALNNALLTANAEDVNKINKEKERLDALLKTYQDKLKQENLGQIAGPSDLEQQMLEREQLLAEEGEDVGKLAALFGRKRGDVRTGKYGALESQIYGKDLEAIQEAARAGLVEKGVAERATDTALEAYTGQLETSKKGYEATVKSAQDRLDVLKKTPKELVGYTKDELLKLFNNNKTLVEDLFKFDESGKVTDTKVSQTRAALEDRLTKLTGEKEKISGEIEKAQGVKDQQVASAAADIFGDPASKKPNIIEGTISSVNSVKGRAEEALRNYMGMSDWRKPKGYSGIVWNLNNIISQANAREASIRNLEKQAREAQKNNNIDRLKSLKTEIAKLSSYNLQKELENVIGPQQWNT